MAVSPSRSSAARTHAAVRLEFCAGYCCKTWGAHLDPSRAPEHGFGACDGERAGGEDGGIAELDGRGPAWRQAAGVHRPRPFRASAAAYARLQDFSAALAAPAALVVAEFAVGDHRAAVRP